MVDTMNALRRFSTFLALALVVGGSTVLRAQMAPVDPNAPRLLTVSGQETVRIPATLAELSIIIEAREKTSAAATQAVIEPSKAVLAFLQQKGAERVQAGALTLNPIYSRSKVSSMSANGEPEITGYLAQWNATFTVPAERAGEFAAGVVDSGANRVTRFEFTADDAAITTARREALQAATREARDTAVAVLSTLNYELREVVRIHVNSNGPIRPMQRGMMMSAMAADSSGPAATEPGFIDVDGNVTLEVRY